MGRIKLKAARVYQTASLFLESGAISQAPPWYTTIGQIPPSEILTRTQPIQHQEPRSRPRTRKPSKLFRPQPILYEEDQLRIEFYRDHPWELARPRIILETDGKNGQSCDWSRLEQRGRPLNGERYSSFILYRNRFLTCASVIQRQLWLMHNAPDMTKSQAYDIARKEFYAIRQEEEVERRIAKEEALSTGAYFGKGVLEVGMELEDSVYEQWKKWATSEVELIERQRDAAYSKVGTEGDDDVSSLNIDEDAVEEGDETVIV